MMKTYFSALLIILLIVSCTKSDDESKQNQSVVPENSLNGSDELSSDIIFQSFPKISTQNLPTVDSTNFDNYKDQDGIKDDFFIQKIKFQIINDESENIRLRYRINYSDQFYSAVITYRNGEHELFTTLVNIDNSKKIIDHLNIAYDEIAESAFQKTSFLEQHKIVVKDFNYMGEDAIISTAIYQISKEGKFKLIAN